MSCIWFFLGFLGIILASFTGAIGALGVGTARYLYSASDGLRGDPEQQDRVEKAAMAHLGVGVLALALGVLAVFGMLLLARP